MTEEISKSQQKKINRLAQTAARTLWHRDINAVGRAKAYPMAKYLKEIVPFVIKAMDQVHSCHVPARAVKLYMSGEDA